MRIKELHLKNFRSHVDTKIKFSRLSIFRGSNSAGKSSIEQAIEIALASHAQGTTADGKGSAALVRLGAKRADIGLLLEQDEDSARRLEVVIKESGEKASLITDPNDENYAFGAEARDRLYADRHILSALVNNRFFVEMDDDKQRDLLSAIIFPLTYEWPEWLKPASNRTKLPIDWMKPPIEVIKQGYELAYKARTGVNRALKEHRGPSPINVEEPDMSLAEIDELLNARKDELRSKQQDRAGILAGGVDHKRKALEQRLNLAIERHARAQTDLNSLSGTILSAAALKKAQSGAKGAKRAQELDVMIARLSAERELKKRAKDSVQKVGATCETCKRPYTEEDLANIAAPILDAYNKINEDYTAAVDERKALGNPQGDQKAVEEHERAKAERERAAGLLADEEKALRAVQKDIDMLGAPASAPNTEAIDAEIADLEGRIARGNQVRADRLAYDRQKQDAASSVKQKAGLEEEQRELEKLVKYFDVEAKNQILGEKIGAFMADMNKVLSSWGYRCQLEFEPKYRFSITFRNSDAEEMTVPLAFLSKSQRYRFATAFQVALAEVSGYGFVVVDEADIFDHAGKEALMEMLLDSNLEQAIVMMTDERQEAPVIDGVRFFYCDDVAQEGMIPTTKVREL
jgi:hypothetical protein